MEEKMMKSNGAGSRSSAMKRRRLFSAAAVLLAVCLVFVGAVVGAESITPNAIVTELTPEMLGNLKAPPLTFALQFTDDTSVSYDEKYNDWYADFSLTLNKDITASTSILTVVNKENGEYTISQDQTVDGYLAGYYGPFGWVPVPDDAVPLPADASVFIMRDAGFGSDWTYFAVKEFVKEFYCGLYLTDEYMGNPDNKGLEVTLCLLLINPDDSGDIKIVSEHKFTPPYSNITFADVDESGALVEVYEEHYLKHGSAVSITAPGNPTKTGYTFQKWNASIPDEMPAYDVLIVPEWKANTTTITLMDGDSNVGTATATYDSGDIQDLTNLEKTGHSFDGWYTTTDLDTKIISSDGNLVPGVEGYTDADGDWKYNGESLCLCAKWTINQYTITFVTDGGSAVDSITQDYGTYVTAPATNPTKEGYLFAGWDKDIPSTMPAEDTTVTALWTEKTYGLSAAPAKVGFDSVKIGYSPVAAKEVTITNNGNVAVTLDKSDSASYTIGGLPVEIVAGGSAKITIQPNAGLPVGNYDATLEIISNGQENIEIPVSFLVYQPSGSGSGDGGALSFPRFTENGGLVDFGSSKVIKAVLLPEGSSGSVLLKVDTVEKWPKALETEYTFDISVEKLGDGMAHILFEIPVSTLDRLGITPADIGVYHLVDEVWVKLAVTYEVKDGTVFYEAETDSFSPFKLVIEEGAAVPKEEETVPVIPPTEEPDVPDEPEILPPIDEPTKPADEPETPAPILAVLAGLGAAFIVRRK